jgi:arginyl-tRNA synthetase
MESIKSQLEQTIKELYHLDFDVDLTPAPENIPADYSTNAPLRLARDLHKAPMAIAEELKGKFDNAEVSTPGFLNFTIASSELAKKINELDQDFSAHVSSGEYAGKTVICEFSDPNPFKVLHVGHLYTSIVGDSISRLFENGGAKVIRANFGGDVGLHVAKTMYVLRQKPIDKLTIEDIAKCYVEGTAAYEDNEKAHQEITELNKEIYRINAEGIGRERVTEEPQKTFAKQNFGEREEPAEPTQASTIGSSNNLAELYWKGRELSYDYFKAFYTKIGVEFDKFYPESTVADLGLTKVKEQLKNGVYEYSDGAVIFNGDKYGLHTRVFINKEGVPTYETKDVGLIFTKWQDYHFDKSIVITGNEQLDYMKVVLKSVEQYAPELVEKTTHLTHGLVKLPGNVKMSSRKGNFLKAVDVLDMVRDALKEEHDSEDETVSLAATKYAFLKYKMGGNIVFDPKESVKMTGNSGPYLLYSCVRAKKILSKVHSARVADDDAILKDISFAQDEGLETVSREGDDPSEVREPRNDGREQTRSKNLHSSERDLIKKILEYRTVLDEAGSEMAPHKVANYLSELAQTFSRFYENCEVIGSNQEPERIKLVEQYLATMTHGLNILGINIPEEM